ncbi:MAG: hypothetical protein ACUVR3_14490 [Candidatus Roseilinea sp.]
MAVSIVMIALGIMTLGRRGELATEQTREAGAQVEKHFEAGAEDTTAGASVSVDYFRGLRKGFAFYGEKETSEIFAMARQGRLSEAWPWLSVWFGMLLAFLWIPLLVGIVAGLDDTLRCLLVLFIFGGALFAALPRRK